MIWNYSRKNITVPYLIEYYNINNYARMHNYSAYSYKIWWSSLKDNNIYCDNSYFYKNNKNLVYFIRFCKNYKLYYSKKNNIIYCSLYYNVKDLIIIGSILLVTFFVINKVLSNKFKEKSEKYIILMIL